MLGEIKAAVTGAAGIAFLILGLALGLLAGGVIVRAYDDWFTIPAAERAAATAATTATDAKWQKLLNDARDLAETIRRSAEKKIAAAERDFIEKDAIRASQMTALEQALEQEQANAPIPSPADRSCVCRPAVTRGLRDALQGVGRAGSGAHPPKPDATVRPSR